jgi:hypothetical protein
LGGGGVVENKLKGDKVKILYTKKKDIILKIIFKYYV